MSGVTPNNPAQTPVFAVVAPAAAGGFQSSAANNNGGSPTSSLANAASTPGGPQQLEQIFFTASLLVSGTQIPIAPYEKIVVAPPVPNQPVASYAPPMLPVTLGITIPTVGARPMRLGGTGGNSSLNVPENTDSIFGNNLQEDELPSFGKREGEGPSTEVPTQELIDQLSGLGEMDDLFRNDVVPPTGPAPGTGTSPDESDLLHDDFDFDASGSSGSNVQKGGAEAGSNEDQPERDSLNSDGAALPKQKEAETDQVFAAFAPAPQQSAALAAASDNDWSTRSQAAIGAAVIWLMTSGELAGHKEDPLRRYEIRQNN